MRREALLPLPGPRLRVPAPASLGVIGRELDLMRDDEASDDGATLKRLFDSAVALFLPSPAFEGAGFLLSSPSRGDGLGVTGFFSFAGAFSAGAIGFGAAGLPGRFYRVGVH